jgi:transposase
MMIMPALRKYPQELRDRAVRLVYEARKEDPELSLNAAVVRVGQRTGVKADTLRGWSKQASIDAGERPGVTSSDAVRIKALEAEVKELKRANEIWNSAPNPQTEGHQLHHLQGLDRRWRPDLLVRLSYSSFLSARPTAKKVGAQCPMKMPHRSDCALSWVFVFLDTAHARAESPIEANPSV